MLLISTLAFGSDFSLEGVWKFSDGDGKPVRFVTTSEEVTSLTTQKFVKPDGTLEYKIDQQMSFDVSGAQDQEGVVNFYDSRGCSFENLEVKASFQSPKIINFLITIPRYKVVTYSNGPMNGYWAPQYCEYQGPIRYGQHPTSYRYVCGRRFIKPRKRIDCQLIEYIKVPVQLKRNS